MDGELNRHERLRHDVAFPTASAILASIAHLLREEEQKDFHGEAYTAIRAALEKYDQLRRREEARLLPSFN